MTTNPCTFCGESIYAGSTGWFAEGGLPYHGSCWSIARARIRAAGNAKRSAATKARDRKPDGTLGAGPVVDQSDQRLDVIQTRAVKAAASRTNPGAVARGVLLEAKP